MGRKNTIVAYFSFIFLGGPIGRPWLSLETYHASHIPESKPVAWPDALAPCQIGKLKYNLGQYYSDRLQSGQIGKIGIIRILTIVIPLEIHRKMG